MLTAASTWFNVLYGHSLQLCAMLAVIPLAALCRGSAGLRWKGLALVLFG